MFFLLQGENGLGGAISRCYALKITPLSFRQTLTFILCCFESVFIAHTQRVSWIAKISMLPKSPIESVLRLALQPLPFNCDKTREQPLLATELLALKSQKMEI